MESSDTIAVAAPTPLLQPGHTVWRAEAASRAALLQDGAGYFGTLRETLLNARHSVLIAGWDIDSRTPLVGADGEAPDGLPETLAAFLTALVERRPDLRIKLLLWDYAVLYALERELLPALALHWNTPPQVELCLDDTLPIGAAHHQKLVVVDDCLAFCGGLDLTVRRWDTPAHAPRNRLRRDPQDRAYPPFHDFQLMVEGDAAVALGTLFRERWHCATGEQLATTPPCDSPWPAATRPDFTDCTIGISRTQPGCRGGEEVREVEALYHAMISAAEHCVILENQFFTHTGLAEALRDRLQQRPNLQVLLVAPKTHHTWLEHRTMLAGRIRFMQVFRDAGLQDRVRLVFPQVGRQEVMVHAKLMIQDDAALRIGSANLCHRSMGTDSECDLVLVARDDAERRGIARLRDRILAEHLGLAPAQVGAAIARHGSVFAALDALPLQRHRLLPIDDGPLPSDAPASIELAADPARPIDAAEYLADFTDGPAPESPLPALLRVLMLLVPVAALIALWRWTPLSTLMQPEAFGQMLQSGGAWGPVVALGLFLLLGFLAFPLNVLILGTAAAFGIWPGLFYAAAGALVSAAASYLLGRRIGQKPLRHLLGPRVHRIGRKVGEKMETNGIIAVTAIRLVPVAPFTLVNLVAGAMRIRFLDYMAGTALGLLPGVLLLSALGERLYRILAHPTLANMLQLAALAVLWAAVTWLLQRLVSSLRREA